MNRKRTLGRLALALAVAATAASASFAAEYSLTAGASTVVIAGQNVPVWGFACTATTVAGACPSLGTVTVPGPRLVVPAGEDLIVNLTNNLPEDVSIVLLGEALPAVTGGSVPAGTMTDPQGRTRATSFIAQAPAGGSATFTWTGLRAGTFLYQSGSHVTRQVHMGLYGAVTKNAVDAAPPAKAQAYAGVEYDNEVIMFYSEVDRRCTPRRRPPTPSTTTRATSWSTASPTRPATRRSRPATRTRRPSSASSTPG